MDSLKKAGKSMRNLGVKAQSFALHSSRGVSPTNDDIKIDSQHSGRASTGGATDNLFNPRNDSFAAKHKRVGRTDTKTNALRAAIMQVRSGRRGRGARSKSRGTREERSDKRCDYPRRSNDMCRFSSQTQLDDHGPAALEFTGTARSVVESQTKRNKKEDAANMLLGDGNGGSARRSEGYRSRRNSATIGLIPAALEVR